MNKKQIVLLLLVTFVFTWLVNLVIGNWLTARVSTLPLARQLNLFNPQAPIVVNNREVVRVNNSNDAVETAQNAKSKVSSVVYIENDQLVKVGSAVNWTSDGYFVSTDKTFLTPGKIYAVITGMGDLYQIEEVYSDPSSSLVLIKTSAKDLPVLDLVDQNDVRLGQQLIAIQNSTTKDMAEFESGYVSKLPVDVGSQIFESDLLARVYRLQSFGSENYGLPILNLNGKLVAIWDGEVGIGSDRVEAFVNSFFVNEQQAVRPGYGFSYQVLNDTEAKALQVNSGVRIVAVAPNKSAANAGLKPGDIVLKFNQTEVNLETDFDHLLKTVAPEEIVQFVIERNGVSLDYPLTTVIIK
ncbi:MAG: PDZ domain-containing protein [Candidatus Doudnabacteria bacterium]